MVVTNATAAAAADTTGFDGAAACYATYINTVKNPPSGYIPGSAQIDLASCLASNEDLSGNGPGLRPAPPATPIVLTPAPPSLPPINTTPPNDDANQAYLRFFEVEGSGFYVFPRTLEEAKQLFDRYSQIVCAAIASNAYFFRWWTRWCLLSIDRSGRHTVNK